MRATLLLALLPLAAHARPTEFQIPEKVVMEKENDFFGAVRLGDLLDDVADAATTDAAGLPALMDDTCAAAERLVEGGPSTFHDLVVEGTWPGTAARGNPNKFEDLVIKKGLARTDVESPDGWLVRCERDSDPTGGRFDATATLVAFDGGKEGWWVLVTDGVTVREAVVDEARLFDPKGTFATATGAFATLTKR